MRAEMGGGKFLRGKKALRLSTRQLVLLILAGVQLLLAGLCGLGLHRVRNALITQSAAKAWRGESEMRFAQLSVFLPNDNLATEDDVRSFRQALDSALVTASLEAPEGGSLCDDAYSGTASLTVQNGKKSVSVKTVGVGGDFFLFHPLRLISGSYLTADDFMRDRVVLDENLAWALFGSSDVAGMSVTINGLQYPIAGVVAREDDFATKKAYTDDVGMFMCIEAMNAISETKLSCYELVAPNMVSGFAYNIVQEKFKPDGGVIVENSKRFSTFSLLDIVLNFGTRSMNEKGILYPYWENAARMCEDYAALYLLGLVLFLIYPIVLAIVWLVKLIRNTAERVGEEVAETVEQKIEENKEKHYTRTGI